MAARSSCASSARMLAVSTSMSSMTSRTLGWTCCTNTRITKKAAMPVIRKKPSSRRRPSFMARSQQAGVDGVTQAAVGHDQLGRCARTAHLAAPGLDVGVHRAVGAVGVLATDGIDQGLAGPDAAGVAQQQRQQAKLAARQGQPMLATADALAGFIANQDGLAGGRCRAA